MKVLFFLCSFNTLNRKVLFGVNQFHFIKDSIINRLLLHTVVYDSESIFTFHLSGHLQYNTIVSYSI
jgi:hypothetical protein